MLKSDIDRAEMYPKLMLVVISVTKDKIFYLLGTKLCKLKTLYTKNRSFFPNKIFKHQINRHRKNRFTWND